MFICASPLREAQMNRSRGDVGEKLHREAGSVLGLHRRLHTRQRPAPGRDRHAAPFRGQPAIRAPDGAHAGASRPDPPPARGGAQHRGATRPGRPARPSPPSTAQILCAEKLVDVYRDPGWGDKNPGRVSGSTSSEAASRTQSPKGSVRTTVPVVSVTSNDRLRAEFSDAPDLSDSATISRPEARASWRTASKSANSTASRAVSSWSPSRMLNM